MIFVTVSTGHFDPLIEACESLKNSYEFLAQIGDSRFVPSFSHFRTCTPGELEAHMSRADLVVSHGGTGMLSTLHRLKKRAVVIPKQKRYGESNDGQIELAKKWAELGMAVLCLDVNNLKNAIEEGLRYKPGFVQFPSLGKALREELGW